MLIALEKCCSKNVYLKYRRKKASGVLNLYLSACLDFFGADNSLEPSQFPFAMKLPSERVMSEKKKDLGIEEFCHLSLGK